MTAKELIEQLSMVAPDTENSQYLPSYISLLTSSNANVDELHVFFYDDIYNDFFGTPGTQDSYPMASRCRNSLAPISRSLPILCWQTRCSG